MTDVLGGLKAEEAADPLLTTAEVAALFRVEPKTVSRWVQAGKLSPHTRTLGNHYRFRRSTVLALLDELIEEVAE